MNYSDMSDAEINRRVAWVVYPEVQAITRHSHREDVQIFHKNNCYTFKDFCNSWADAGPIIEHNSISIVKYDESQWRARSRKNMPGVIDKSPLRAAMIVFLIMQEEK